MIPLAIPNLTGKEKEYVADAIASGWVSGGGPYVERFEEMVAKAAGRKWAVATITGTAALHVSMRVLRFEGRIEVPELTFVAAYNVIRQIGCVPVPQDVGLSHDEARICQSSRDWPLLIDAAPAIGIELPEATLHTFSFNGNKTVTTGQGGAIVGDDPILEKFIRELIVPKEGGEFNYRMANVNAAMGCAQMERLDEFLEKKRAILKRYSESLDVFYGGISCWMSLWHKHARFAETLQERDIDARPLWSANHVICLPCSTSLTEAEQDKVIKACESLR